jgi:hypothetical protein
MCGENGESDINAVQAEFAKRLLGSRTDDAISQGLVGSGLPELNPKNPAKARSNGTLPGDHQSSETKKK